MSLNHLMLLVSISVLNKLLPKSKVVSIRSSFNCGAKVYSMLSTNSLTSHVVGRDLKGLDIKSWLLYSLSQYIFKASSSFDVEMTSPFSVWQLVLTAEVSMFVPIRGQAFEFAVVMPLTKSSQL